MEFDYAPGATPLDPDETAGLKLSHITQREELDRWEHDNIMEAENWTFRRTISVNELLSVNFVLKLHKRMLGDVWKWAGTFRSSQKNIGGPASTIVQDLGNLLNDVKIWIEQDVYPPDEIAARFHHKLVFIHPFANGNGRHARLMTDLLLAHVLGHPRFSWGSRNLMQPGECRKHYIAALQAADEHDYGPLLDFVHS